MVRSFPITKLPNYQIPSLHSQQLHIKNQCGIWRDDSTGPSGSVSQIWWDAQLALAADFHSSDTFVPAFNYLARPQCELKWMSGADGTVELFSVGEPSGVLNLYFLSGGGDRAGADLDVPILQPRCRFGARASDLGWTSCGGMGSGGGLLCWGVARLSLRNAHGRDEYRDCD